MMSILCRLPFVEKSSTWVCLKSMVKLGLRIEAGPVVWESARLRCGPSGPHFLGCDALSATCLYKQDECVPTTDFCITPKPGKPKDLQYPPPIGLPAILAVMLRSGVKLIFSSRSADHVCERKKKQQAAGGINEAMRRRASTAAPTNSKFTQRLLSASTLVQNNPHAGGLLRRSVSI